MWDHRDLARSAAPFAGDKSAYLLAVFLIWGFGAFWLVLAMLFTWSVRKTAPLPFSLAWWAFTYAFVYSASDKEVLWIWFKLSAVGWCLIGGIALHLALILTQQKIFFNITCAGEGIVPEKWFG